MKYLSVCSGIEAASVAWHPLGWTPAAFSEIEAFPRAVLAHRFPHVPLHGDFTTIKGDEYGAIDLLVGGTPCQSFSVAGLRGGLADQRGNLALEFLRLAQRTRARWLVWENVPGVLSSNGGRDFGSIIGGMVELGYGVTYRVLDAQFFGVPQRRRRVFVVGYLGDWRRAAAVLFERYSLSGHPAPRRQTGKGLAPTLAARTRGGGGLGTDFDCDGGLIADTLTVGANQTYGFSGEMTPIWPASVAPTLNAAFGDKQGLEDQHALNGAGLFVPTVMSSGQAQASIQVDLAPQAHGVMAFSAKDHGADAGDIAPTLRAGGNRKSNANGGVMPAVVYALGSHAGAADGIHTNNSHASGGPVGSGISENVAYSLRAGRQQSIASVAVRRLTPRECERLQGFPDDWTLVPYRGRANTECPDGPRYKALGNSMAVPCMRWIGERIQTVEGLNNEA